MATSNYSPSAFADRFTAPQGEPVTVKVNRVASDPSLASTLTREDLERDLARVRKLAKLLDSQFEIAGVKVGWDAIVGLIPVAGDIATSLIGLYPLVIANKHKLGKAVQTRMALNLLVDWSVGAVPVLGDVFDVAFKANLKNLKLLEKAVEKAQLER